MRHTTQKEKKNNFWMIYLDEMKVRREREWKSAFFFIII
jgi:hypothetical protein